jgi:hypothetical protein
MMRVNLHLNCRAVVLASVLVFASVPSAKALPLSPRKAPTNPATPISLPVAPSWCETTDDGYRCLYGPVDVPAGEEVRITSGMAAPSEAGYITSARATLVTRDGKRIGRHLVHLHHSVWLNPNKRDMTCGSFDGIAPNYDRFFASGKERTPMTLPRGYGYYWSNDVPQPYTTSAPWFGLIAHLDGMHGSSETYIELDMTFVREAEATEMIDVRPVWLDVRNCSSDPVFDVKKGSGRRGRYIERWRYEMPEGGRFVFLGGHLHDGGLRLRLENMTRDEKVFTSRALYELKREPWYLTGMTSMTRDEGIAVGAGDVLRLSAIYDSTRSWRDVMGIMVGALAPSAR